MSEKEMLKISVEEFSRLQDYMSEITDKESGAYKKMKRRYIFIVLFCGEGDVVNQDSCRK